MLTVIHGAHLTEDIHDLHVLRGVTSLRVTHSRRLEPCLVVLSQSPGPFFFAHEQKSKDAGIAQRGNDVTTDLPGRCAALLGVSWARQPSSGLTVAMPEIPLPSTKTGTAQPYILLSLGGYRSQVST